jgi:hypothetical protein
MAVWSIVPLSAAQEAQRFDSDYWHPNSLANEARLAKLDCTTIGEESAFVRCGPFGSNLLCENYVPNGVLVLRPFNIKRLTVERENLAYVPEEVCTASRLGYYQEGDIMFARVGDVRAGVLPDFPTKVTISPNVIAARLKPGGLNPYYVAAFLNTAAGMDQLVRGMKTVAQPTITVDLVHTVKVPRLTGDFQESIAALVKASFAQEDESRALLTAADAMLNEALGLADLDLTAHLFYEARFADASAAARMDAEYFQPAKREVLAALTRMPGGHIGAQFRSVRQLWQPDRAGPGEGVRNYDLTDALSPFLDDTVGPTTADQIGSTKKALTPGDLVISRLRSYLEEIAVVLPGGDTPLVGSSEFIVLRPNRKALPVEALLVYLRSPYVQTILKWCQDGSNHPRFDEKELLAIPIPDKITKIQDQLAAKVKDSIAARRESRRLLDTAKRAVEMAIEENEAAALRFLKEARG